MKLPLRDRILNAFAAGFSPEWIAHRFETTTNAVFTTIVKARRRGDERASYIPREMSAGRAHATWMKKNRAQLIHDGFVPQDLSEWDQFPDLPEVDDWASLKAPRLEVDETAFDWSKP